VPTYSLVRRKYSTSVLYCQEPNTGQASRSDPIPTRTCVCLHLSGAAQVRAEALTAEQGVPALHTDELGTVEFVTDGERLWVQAGWNTTPN
jgi:hypothetical protein